MRKEGRKEEKTRIFFVFIIVHQRLYHLSKVAKCMAVGHLPEMDPEIPISVQELIIQCWNLNPKVHFSIAMRHTFFRCAQMYNFSLGFLTIIILIIIIIIIIQ
jgi:hypothetical protein